MSKRRKNKRRKRLFIIISITVIVLLLGYILYDKVITPQIKLKGGKTIKITYKTEYKEKGYSASHFNKNITKDVKTNGKVDTSKLGEYKVTYEVGEGLLKKKETRTVKVIDNEKPKMNITKEDVYVCPGSEIVPEKVVATDNYDGDISNKVKHTIKDNKITYTVKDSSGNITEITKKIVYKDKEKPNITLNGSEEMFVSLGSDFSDPGVKAEDNCDGDLTNKVTKEENIDFSKIGDNEIKYSVSDKSGNKATVTRKVIVSNGVVYLTFDDGPNDGTTNVILDILKEEGVKATFFVTNKGPDELIKREYDEGHTVALHTATHNYATVYASDEAYFNDLYSVQDRVKRITGQESKIIRFPGGSSNTISRKYSPGIMSRLTQEVQNRGFKYYDWNISSGDAGNTTDPNVVYSNVVNSLKRERPNMVLMHDIKTYTRDALRNIIKYGKENGYKFEQITMDTEMVTQRVNN